MKKTKSNNNTTIPDDNDNIKNVNYIQIAKKRRSILLAIIQRDLHSLKSFVRSNKNNNVDMQLEYKVARIVHKIFEQNSHLVKEKSTLKNRNVILMEDNKELKQKLSRLQNENQELEKKADKIKYHYEHKIGLGNTSEMNIIHLKTEIEKLKGLLDGEKNRNIGLIDMIQQERISKNKFEIAAISNNKEIDRIKKQHTLDFVDLRQSFDVTKNKILENQTEMFQDKLKSAVENLSNEIENLNHKLHLANADNEKLENNMELLRNKFMKLKVEYKNVEETERLKASFEVQKIFDMLQATITLGSKNAIEQDVLSTATLLHKSPIKLLKEKANNNMFKRKKPRNPFNRTLSLPIL